MKQIKKVLKISLVFAEFLILLFVFKEPIFAQCDCIEYDTGWKVECYKCPPEQPTNGDCHWSLGTCGGGPCFTGDTPIRMADDSQKPISEVKEGEMVKSFSTFADESAPADRDPQTVEITESKVTKVYKHPKEQIKGYYLLTLESGKQIKVTPEHPILVLDEKGERVWKTVEEIDVGTYALVYDESGDIVQRTDDTEEAEAVLDQQQSPSSHPSLLQILFPPLWLLSKVFKN